VHALGDVNLNNASTKESYAVESESGGKSCLNDGIRQMKPIFLKPYLSRILLLVTTQFCGMLWRVNRETSRAHA
jgi:hypothetical protein